MNDETVVTFLTFFAGLLTTAIFSLFWAVYKLNGVIKELSINFQRFEKAYEMQNNWWNNNIKEINCWLDKLEQRVTEAEKTISAMK